MTVAQQQLLLEYIAIEENDDRYSPKGIDGQMGKNTQAALNHVKDIYGVDASGLPGIIGKTVAKKKTSTSSFWDEIRYFTRTEFKCPCPRCGGYPVEPVEKLVRIADNIREKAGKPAHISSGVRCAAHNAELSGSVSNSRHLKGWAMDFRIDGMTSTQLDALVGAQAGVAYHYKIDDRYVHMDVIL